MFDFQQKRKLRSAFESPITWGMLLVLCILMAMSAYDRYQIAKDMAERRAEVERELAALEERKVELESEVEYLKGERGIEAEMRRQFDVAKEGEQVVIIVEDETAEPPAMATTTIPEPPSRPWYRFW
jgi:cell division protein FtsB